MRETNTTLWGKWDFDSKDQENLYKTLESIFKGVTAPLGNYIQRSFYLNKRLSSNIVVWPKTDKELTINELKSELMHDKNLKLFLMVEQDNFIFHPQIRNTKKFPIARYKGKELAITNRQNTVFKVNSELLNPKYLSLLFHSELIESKLFFLAGSGLQGGISWEEFKSLPIKVPSLELQQKFIDIYELLEKEINKRREINLELENIMFSKFQKLQEEYGEYLAKIKELYLITVGWIFSAREESDIPAPNLKIPFLSREQVISQERKFISDIQLFIPPSNIKNYQLPKVSKNSIIIVKLLLMHLAAVAQEIISNVSIVQEETHLHQELCGLHPFKEIGLYYGYFLIKGNINSLSQKASITRTRYVLSKETIENFEVTVVSQEKIDEFNEFCKPFFELQNCNEEIIKELRLLQKYAIECISLPS